jgi:predicted AlkP superfamily phosphohydrolase/phosphomutase
MPSRLLVLGIDAASPALLRRWAAEDKLPALRRCMDSGLHGPVEGLPGFYVGSTWPSFSTGLNPARHGFYRIEQLRPGTYEFFRPLEESGGVGGVPFWKAASDAGRRVAVLDVPLTRVEEKLNGLQVVEWGGHDSVFGFHASSPRLMNEVLSIAGEYPLPSDCDEQRTSAQDFERFLQALERAIESKAKLTRALLAREPWDLFVQVFTESHCVGHQCWHIHDPSHPAHDPELLRALGDPLERVYRALDRAIDQILQGAGDGHVLVVAAHGMSSYRGAQFLLPEVLYRLGAAVPPSQPPPHPGPAAATRQMARTLWRTLPAAAQEALRPFRDRIEPEGPAGGRSPLRADLGRSPCFPVPNGMPVGGIRLNLIGREPRGVLRPGAEADQFCETLRRELLSIVDVRTGRPLVASVERTKDLYAGERLAALPDLLVEWSATPTGSKAHAGGRGATVRASSPRIGEIEGSNAYVRTGEHLPTGMFLWTGPGVPARERERVSVMDFHPTLCRLLGAPAPAVDGRILAELERC